MQKKTILLDGGMGQELIKNSKSKPHPLWSTYVIPCRGRPGGFCTGKGRPLPEFILVSVKRCLFLYSAFSAGYSHTSTSIGVGL